MGGGAQGWGRSHEVGGGAGHEVRGGAKSISIIGDKNSRQVCCLYQESMENIFRAPQSKESKGPG